MNKTTEALKMAIEAMKFAISNEGMMLLSDPPQSAWKFHGCEKKLEEAINACKEALESQEINMNKTLECPAYLHGMKFESQEQEPVAWRSEGGVLTEARLQAESWVSHGGKATPLYTHPAQPLTQEIYLQLKNQSTRWTSSLPMFIHLLNKHFGIDDGLDWGQQAHGIGEKK